MFKKFIFFLFLLAILVNPTTIFAQQSTKSNQVITRVGEAPEDQKPNISPTPGPPGEQKPVQGILDWASQITNNLQKGWENLLNRLLNTFSNGIYSAGPCPPNCVAGVYWCTHLIVDSYRLAGYEGLDRTAHAAVVNMRKWWYTTGKSLGYIYVDYGNDKQSLSQVQPGYAMFMERVAGQHTDDEHVNIIKEILVDANGNGNLVTLDSNSTSRSREHNIRNWEILSTPYPVRGFGGI